VQGRSSSSSYQGGSHRLNSKGAHSGRWQSEYMNEPLPSCMEYEPGYKEYYERYLKSKKFYCDWIFYQIDDRPYLRIYNPSGHPVVYIAQSGNATQTASRIVRNLNGVNT
jgi:hypothetical protein